MVFDFDRRDLPARPPRMLRPVFVLPGVTEKRLVISYADAVDKLGEGWAYHLHDTFASGKGCAGVWVLPHPDDDGT